MTAQQPTTTATAGGATCANCNAANPRDSRFCSGCGENLWESCKKCKQQARIGTAFCGNCGANLIEMYELRRKEMVDTLVQVRDLGMGHEYEDAILLAEAVCEPPDYRFKDIAEKAKTLQGKLRERRDSVEQKMQQITAEAKRHFEAEEFSALVDLLTPLPAELLSDECKEYLTKAQVNVSEEQALAEEIRETIAEKKFHLVGSRLDRMLQLRPQDAAYSKLAQQIGQQLMKLALQLCDRNLHPDAKRLLEGTPLSARDEKYAKLNTMLDEIIWLRGQVKSYPYATTTLAKLCERLTKIIPNDQESPAVYKKIVSKIKSGSGQDERGLYSPWQPQENKTFNCGVEFLGKLLSLDIETTTIEENPLRFCAAIGAALQGVERSRYKMTFGGKQESGLRKLLGRKPKEKVAWGIDIGGSGIQAVRMVSTQEGPPKITDAELMPFTLPASRSSSEAINEESKKLLAALIEKYPSIKEEAVWSIVPTRQGLGRFQELPPADDKKIKDIVATEVSSRFPVGADQLVWDSELEAKSDDGIRGRYCSIIAVRDFILDNQTNLFSEVGIELAGVQVAAIAIANVMDFEFSDQLDGDDGTGAEPAIGVLDVGIGSTALVYCTRRGFWYRSFDIAGEAFTASIAKGLAVTLEQADALKTNITNHHPLAPVYDGLQDPFGKFRHRLDQLSKSNTSELGETQLQKLWCTGGGALMHGFIQQAFTDAS